MNAFLTYKNQTIIHFDALESQGIYLISGSTGSGKTSIFDAITFALYGVASGSHRTPSYLRSDFADAKDETYVELEFELHHHLYTVKRTPTYSRPGYKTPKNTTAILKYDDIIIEGVKEVNAKINELLGVDVHQFKQIVMISQGEFTKLIYSSSEEREKVLRHIFHSELLVEYENLLKEKCKQYKEQYLISLQQLSSRYQLLQFSNDFLVERNQGFHPSYIDEAKKENEKYLKEYDQLSIAYQKLHNEYDQLYQKYFQNQQNNLNIQHYESLNEEYQQLLEKETSYQEKSQQIKWLQHIQEHQSFIQHHQSLQQEIEKISSKLEQYQQLLLDKQKSKQEVEQRYNLLPSMEKDKENLMLELKTMEKTLTQQRDYQNLLKSYHTEKKKLERKEHAYQEELNHYQKLQKRMERDQESVNELPRLEYEKQQKENLVQEMNKKRVMIHELSELYDQYKECQDVHYEYAQRYQKANEQYQNVLAYYHQEDEKYRQQQAGILALNLKDNEPCPVCGSHDHPSPAKLSLEVLSIHELDQLLAKVEKEKEYKENIYQDTLQKQQELNQLNTKINVLKKQFGIEGELSQHVFVSLLCDIMSVIEEQEKTYQKRQDQIIYLNKLKNSLEQDKNIAAKKNLELESRQLELQDLKTQVTSLKTQIELQKNEMIDNQDLEDNYRMKQNDYHQLNQTITNIQERYHSIQKEYTNIETQVNEMKERLKIQQKEFYHLDQQMQIWINEHFPSKEIYHQSLHLVFQLHQLVKECQDYEVKKRTIKAQMKVYQDKIEGVTWVDLSSMSEQLNILEHKRNQSFQDKNQLQQMIDHNQRIIEQLEKEYHAHQDILKKYTLYQDLSDMTSGKNEKRLSFERYVLATYFEHILEYANVELLKMSQGRFSLYRKNEIKGTKQQGLELCVLDYETGMMRDIQSLSGGESFKAALALALGLSAMIQNYAGGIELQTLFIDEGFGSLDSESLDQALSVLLDLKNDNKTIGIISHVPQLKERIEAQIIVERGSQGSYVKIKNLIG